MDVCEKCGTDLGVSPAPFLRCSSCGWENDGPVCDFDCGPSDPKECEWCDEPLCCHRAALDARV